MQGVQVRTAIPAMTVSAFVRHRGVAAIDLLLESATAHEPSSRPSMELLAAELRGWLYPPTRPASNGPLDLSAYARDLGDLATQAAAEQQQATERRERIVLHATRIRERFRPIALSVHGALEEAGFQMERMHLDAHEWGFAVLGRTAAFGGRGGRILLTGEISIDTPKEGWGKLSCSFNTGTTLKSGPSWSREWEFFLGGAQEAESANEAVQAIQEAFAPSVERAIQFARGELP